MIVGARGPGTLAKYCDTRRIPTEGFDVFLDPTQRNYLILQAHVSRNYSVFRAQKPWMIVRVYSDNSFV